MGDRYVVHSGDCLWKIARATLGAGEQWPRIWRYNNRREVVRVTGSGIPNPDMVHPGQVLLIPRLSTAPRYPLASGSEAPPNHGSTLKPGPRGQAESLSPSVRRPLSDGLSQAQSPVAMKFCLGDMHFPPMVQPGMVLDVKMTGDILLMSHRKIPAVYVTQRRELEIQAMHQANEAFRFLLSDTKLIYDDKDHKLTYSSMLVAKSSQPHSWATAVGVKADSSNPLPKLRFEFRAPDPLEGALPQHTYRAIGVKIVIELTPTGTIKSELARFEQKPQAIPASVPATNWGKVFGAGLVVAAGAVVCAVVVDDFLPIGVADDVIGYAAAAKMFAQGMRMVHAGGSVLPKAATPAIVSVTFALATTESSKSGTGR